MNFLTNSGSSTSSSSAPDAARRFDCPECGAALARRAPGSVVACHACGSPAVVPPPARIEAPVATHRRPGVPWARVALAGAAVGLAHLVLYLVLSAGARAEIRRLTAHHGRPALEAEVARPGRAPDVGTPAYASWRAQEAHWQAARAYRKHRQQRDLVGYGLLASFLVQVAVTGWLLMRIAARAARRG